MNLSTPLPPGVTYAMLTADFWLNRLPAPTQISHTAESIAAFNQRVYEILQMPSVTHLADRISSEEVIEEIRAYFTLANKPRFGGNTQPLSASYFENLFHNALPIMPPELTVQFGIVVKRTQVRSFPSSDLIMAEPHDFPFDLAQETSIDVGWPVAVLTTSRDGAWFFCLTPHYWGWVAADDIGVGTRTQVQDFSESQPFVRTVANRGLVALATGGGITPQMGTRLPLIEENDQLYIVRVPIKNSDGALDFTHGYIHKTLGQFHLGDLPCHQTSIFQQAFSLMGEDYTWGDSRFGIFGRDCSRFIRDVYATTGLFLPRNGDQQGKVGKLRLQFTDEMNDEARLQAIVEQGVPGDVLVTPTHVMIYLGQVDGTPYVIHDVTSGQNRIIVSDLKLGENTPKKSLVSRLDLMVSVE